jgi:hypothetical protein
MHHERFETVINALNQCAEDCLHCENSCLEEENVKNLVRCIKLDRECAEICLFTAKMLASDTMFSNEIMKLCANICDKCAEECDKHAQHMEHCRVCAESCKRCAEECRAFAKVSA